MFEKKILKKADKMTNESIFNFLNRDMDFNAIHKDCLEFEKLIANEHYKSSLNLSRSIIEGLLQYIIVKYAEDGRLSKELYGQKDKKTGRKLHPSLSNVLYKSVTNKHITSGEYNKLKRFIDNYGNNASHFNNKIFSLEDAKVAHKIIFDFCLSTFQRIFKSFDKIYEFNLSYLDENKYLTKEEIEDMLKKVKGNEVSTDDVISEIENKGTFITVEQLKEIIEPLNKDISELEKFNDKQYLTEVEINSILSNYDMSLKEDILKTIAENQAKEKESLFKTLNELKSQQITLSEIDNLIQENNENIQKDIFIKIKSIAKEMIKESLSEIIEEIKEGKMIESGEIIDVPEYEVVEIETEEFEIREIEEIIGVPEKCPKCDAKIRKGSTKCDSCGYDFFDELNKRCPICGKRLSMGSEKCPHCEGKETKTCSECGYENERKFKFCVKCGHEL